MFVYFIKTDADDLLTDKRRRAGQASRNIDHALP